MRNPASRQLSSSPYIVRICTHILGLYIYIYVYICKLHTYMYASRTNIDIDIDKHISN